MKRPNYLLILLLPLLFSSCLLESEKENFVTLPATPDPANRSLLVYNFDGNSTYYPMTDTVWLPKSDHINFKLVSGTPYGCEVIIDNTTTQSTQGTALSVYSERLSTGAHKLQFKITVKSGTGSLADHLRSEAIIYTEDHVLMVGEMPFKLIVTDVTKSKGTLKVSWNRYPHKDFQGYEIRKFSAVYSADYSKYRSFFIKDQNQTSFEDSTYIGGKVIYRIVADRGGEYIRSNDKGGEILYKPFMEVTRTSAGKVKLSWTLPPFYKNIKSYQVYKGYQGTVKNVLPSQLPVELDDASIFGNYERYLVRMVADVDVPKIDSDMFANQMDLTVGKRVPYISDIAYSHNNDIYYLLGSSSGSENDFPGGLYKLDKDMNIIDSARYDLHVGSKRDFVLSADGKNLYVMSLGIITRVNLNDLSTEPSYTVKNVSNENPFSGGNLAVSNTNLIQYGGTILDFNTKTIIFSIRTSGPSHLSANGQYFAASGDQGKLNVYQYNGTTFLLRSTLPYTSIRYIRFFDNQSKLLIASYDKVIIYDYLANTELASYAFLTPYEKYYDFNQKTQKYTVIGDQISILDINSGTVSPGQKLWGYGIQPKGDYIFAFTGFASKQ